MPVEVAVYFDKKNVQRVIDSLQALPAHLRPKYFSEEEALKSKKDEIANKKRFEKFIVRNPAGFFLFADDCSYNLFVHERGYSKLFIDVQNDDLYSDVPLFFEAVVSVAPIFGFAGENKVRELEADGSYVITHEKVTNEHDHRNKYFVTIGMNHIESGIGNDLDKYIPGVYWYTLLSDELLSKHGVDLTSLSAEAISTEMLGDGSFYLLKFYENPKDWRKNAERLDNLCEHTDGVFSRSSVESAVSGVSNYLEYDNIIADWQ
jgi:hypothetical protein